MAGPDKIQQKPKKSCYKHGCVLDFCAHPANYYTVVAYYWLLLFLPACINSLHKIHYNHHYASVGGATRHTVVRLFVCVCVIMPRWAEPRGIL